MKSSLENLKSNNHSALCTIHNKMKNLQDERQKYLIDARETEQQTHHLLANEAWLFDKHQKFASQRQISTLRAHLRVAQVCEARTDLHDLMKETFLYMIAFGVLCLQRYLGKQQKKNTRVLMKSTLQNNKTQEDLDAAEAERLELHASVRQFNVLPILTGTTRYQLLFDQPCCKSIDIC